MQKCSCNINNEILVAGTLNCKKKSCFLASVIIFAYLVDLKVINDN